MRKPPEVTTKSEPKIDWEDKFLKSFQKLTYRRRAWDVWRDYILLHACSISNVLDKDNYDQREKRYLKIIHQYSKEEQAIFPELAAYTTMALDQNQEQDFLGKMFMRLDLGNRSAGQFFTPYHVCEIMAEVVATNALEKIEQYGYISINDPCCGAGATLIAGVHVIRKQLEHCEPPRNYQNHILVVAQDVDEIVGLMCYIQISLLGLAGFIKIGNSITDQCLRTIHLKNIGIHLCISQMYGVQEECSVRLTSYLERVMTNEEKIFYSKRAVYVRHQRAL